MNGLIHRKAAQNFVTLRDHFIVEPYTLGSFNIPFSGNIFEPRFHKLCRIQDYTIYWNM